MAAARQHSQKTPGRPWNRQIRSLAPWILFACFQVVRAEEPKASFVPAAEKNTIQSESIKEASGLAMSSQDGGFLWIVNDSGSAPALHLIETGGKDRGKVTLNQAKNTDWEDLASFYMNGTAWLLAADTGDNDAKRDYCTLYILREPRLPPPGENLARSAKAEWKINFRYEGGPRDCEAVAVDVAHKKILLLTKRTNPPEIHELPLLPATKRGVITTRKTGVTSVASPTNSLIPFRDQPTGMDISPDGSMAAVVTYYGVFVFPRKPEESWAEAFARKPEVLTPHRLAQAESVAFAKNGASLMAVSEGRGSRIMRYQKTFPVPRD